MIEFEEGEYVVCNTSNYSITNRDAVCEVLQVNNDDDDGDSLLVKVVARLRGSQIVGTEEFWVDGDHFEEYCSTAHGDPILGALDLPSSIEGVCHKIFPNNRAIITREKLVNTGKTLKVFEVYEGEYCCLTSEAGRPLVFKKTALKFLDDEPALGDYCVQHKTRTPVLCKLVEVTDGIGTFLVYQGDTPATQMTFPVTSFERLNLRNEAQLQALSHDKQTLQAYLRLLT